MKLLEVQRLFVRFGGVVALRDVDVDIREGETLGMIGPNGSGKSTFVNAISGHLAPRRGRVSFEGRDTTGWAAHRLAEAGLLRTYQAVRIFGAMTVRENLEVSKLMRHRAKAGAEDELVHWLRLDGVLERPAGALTLFEQRRLELGCRLLLQPRLLLLDEPVGGLAVNEVREMIALLEELRRRCAIFVIEHTMHVIRALADRVVVLIAGEKVADGPPEQILADRRVIEEYLGAPVDAGA